MKAPRKFDLVDIRKIKEEISNFRELQYSWDEIGKHYDLSAMIVWKIYERGYIPERNDIRQKLGMVEIDYAPSCPICHQAHTHRHGEETYDPAAQVVRPKPKPRKPRARIAIRKDDIASAARTIIKHLPIQDVRALADLLWDEVWARYTEA